ncbi:hypothetical protein [Herbaspirillum sp. SJZ107]|uniref:hypothetical protein n=1 Tax=Herbaspirillum sp. SJZ107 TaxID=2572881 RepID=UPI0011548805|nr:hypothetical protein [Herbaspirillum sp. SJZ107]TQK10219.1 hypothetical protein FBX97_0135 [Herbaspirillum sp. SJZ107]
MRNNEYKKNLDYTEELDKYEGYIIEWAVSPSTSEPSKWMGTFRATKADTPTIFGSLGIPEPSEGDAQDKAIEAAKSMIDEAVASKG